MLSSKYSLSFTVKYLIIIFDFIKDIFYLPLATSIYWPKRFIECAEEICAHQNLHLADSEPMISDYSIADIPVVDS